MEYGLVIKIIAEASGTIAESFHRPKEVVHVLKKIVWLMGLILCLATPWYALGNSAENPVLNGKKIAKITISTPVATISLPMAYIIEKGLLNDYAQKVDLVIWNSNDQFRAQVLNGSVDFVTMPVNAACLFYNKGVKLKMLKVAMWKLFYLVSQDDSIHSVSDLKGKKVVIPFRGDVPDTLFQYLCAMEKLDPLKDMNLQYVPSLLDTTASILGGQADYALMIEPAASQAIMKAKEKNITLKRVLDLQTEWSKYSGIPGGIMPISGVAVMPQLLKYPKIVAAFSKAYDEGVKWSVENPDEAAQLAVKYFEGVNGPAFRESLNYVHFESKSTATVKDAIEKMFAVFLKVNPDSIGAKLPDSNFYYK